MLLEEQHHLWVRLLLLLQQGVALLQGFVVADERLRVGGVVLTDDHIDEATTLLAASSHKNLVGW